MTFQVTLGDTGYSEVHQSTMCRMIWRVSEALARRSVYIIDNHELMNAVDTKIVHHVIHAIERVMQ